MPGPAKNSTRHVMREWAVATSCFGYLQLNVTVADPPSPVNWIDTVGPGLDPDTVTVWERPGARLPLDGLGVTTAGLVGPEADQCSVTPPVFLRVIAGY